jgi:TolA-binding protein
MKNILILFIFIASNANLFADSEAELYIHNLTSRTNIYARVYPISMIINGNLKYDLRASHGLDEFHGKKIQYNTCVERVWDGTTYVKSNRFYLTPSLITFIGFNYDKDNISIPPSNLQGSFGRGIYKIIFYKHVDDYEIIDSCIFEQDNGINVDTRVALVEDTENYGGPGGLGLVYMSIYDNFWGPYKSIELINKHIKMWDPYPVFVISDWHRRAKELGGDNITFSDYRGTGIELFPLDSRKDCDVISSTYEQNQIFPDPYYDPLSLEDYFSDERQGTLTLNLIITKSVQTPTSPFEPNFRNLLDYPNQIKLIGAPDQTPQPFQYLKLEKGSSSYKELKLNKYTFSPFGNPSGSPFGSDIIVQKNAMLWLDGDNATTSNNNSRIIVGPYCNIKIEGLGKLRMQKNSTIILDNLALDEESNEQALGTGGKMKLEAGSILELDKTSKIIINSGCELTICGSYPPTINNLLQAQGTGKILWRPNTCQITPITFNDCYVNDSGNINIDKGSLIIGDSTNLIIEGAGTSLNLKSQSHIKLGKGSKITLKDGAKLIADSCYFESDTSTTVANGIVLKNASSDTKITNCKFENCKTAIKIVDSGGVYNNAEISNNVFNIPTGGDYGIYAKNVDNKIIKNNVFNLPITKTNAMGIYYKNIAQIDTTILEIPDSTSITFKSKTASLSLLSKYSEIKMGAGSKIIFDSTTTFKADNIKFTALDSTKPWGGIFFKNLDTVILNKCTVKGVKVDSSFNNGYSLAIYNSKNTNIDSCSIGDSTGSGGMLLYFQNNTFYYPNVNISNNQIKTRSLIYNGINVAAYSSFMSSINIERNTVTNIASPGGGSGIFTYGIQSSTIKNNTVSNFEKGISAWYSSLDLFQNEVSTISGYNARSVYGVGTAFNMGLISDSWIGGGNKLNTQSGWCVQLDASHFNLYGGYNIFNITDYTYGQHLRGYFPTSPTSDSTIDARYNCFEINGEPVSGEGDVKKYLIWANTSPVQKDLTEPSCGTSEGLCAYYVVENPYNNDTVWSSCDVGYEDGGFGGGENGRFSPQDASYKEVYDGMNINMRKKEFAAAETKCKTLLNSYADSLTSLEAIDKLYFASLVQDINGSKISDLKSYFESYIQNHPGHATIIQRMFYFIQKCKANLGQYASALQGFETIINQFPTSYEGLVARWDYMATNLFSNSGGAGGNEETGNKILTKKQEHEKLVNLVDDPLDNYDKNKFTAKDRKVIVKNIVTAFEDNKTKETKKLTELQSKVSKKKATETEFRDYVKMNTLKEIVRSQRVRSISDQISAVQGDVSKLSDAEKHFEKSDNISTVPYDYKLSQNYPNPFNPTTKINYEIKLAGFVSLKVYDLLGREIAQLINEKQDAGRYMINFDASKYMLASGIYFYRIKVGEFVDTKRMVLVK